MKTKLQRLWLAAGLLGLSACGLLPSSDPCVADKAVEPLRITSAALQQIGQRLSQNETGGRYENLVVWNLGEEFPSLGIGHFIWYPAGYQGPFTETFPDLLRFMQRQGVAMPTWLNAVPAAPWSSRAAFQTPAAQALANELRHWLSQTVAVQTQFIAERLNAALPRLLCAAPAAQREAIRGNFYSLAHQAEGLYPLIDYVNFKGEGIDPAERYQGEGWGLLQVLSQMPSGLSGAAARQAFATAASQVLARRVQNSPPARGEVRWLAGWQKRALSYR